ncbi:hypothetical protein P3719_04665 [Vibrio parahaemolyticus]|uniref:hypothetical protein n=1 Tax=Vibrio parahaemolyticus TaxID=670 RepID=UPI000A4EE316|nr:hypothetical protein [Vibrio parahaemolyticus]MCA6688051.1 hypothetical protein [Vibrio parahaemolyticus]MDF5582160.1 hypothetical protein [Vibrio parahaemolyticus]MDF5587642.1 hypothetical protein [Vibrio parahaemolyticus]MDG2874900.1 hypothetical protein [Vibrio parahaemolyticus]MDG2892126.1 hypothetical protein [Vibrio parahaemolyticus]
MSKHPNPIRGHVSCPVCHTASTVHRVGEGKLIAEGEPTKNGRNLGLLYYKCPNCGNSPMSKSINAFVESNMVDSVEQLEVSDAVTIDAELPTVEPVVETVASIDIPSVEAIEQVNAPSVETEPPTEPEPVKNPPFPVKKVLAGIAFVALLIWAIRQLMPTKQPTEPESEQGETVNAG